MMEWLFDTADRYGLTIIVEPPSRSSDGLAWTVAAEPLPGGTWCGVARRGVTREEAVLSVREGIEAWEANGCLPAARSNRDPWSQRECVDAARVYHDRYGSWPDRQEWDPSYARYMGREEAAANFLRDRCYPSAQTVRRLFGSWETFTKRWSGGADVDDGLEATA